MTQNEERTLKDRYTLQTSDGVFLKGFQIFKSISKFVVQTEAQDLLFQRSDSGSGESMRIKHRAAFKIEPLVETINFLKVPHKINRVG
ncbi:hypothetical protein BA171_07365 [Candidatus Hamiltonella defensa (Bemisia tabaci)]|uniref:Uncharacterized protein n=1 Tax=Candidatus Hamiltonella defensa (Bemisia tabaci) TaxID=672795 RepID=A0A249DZY4_9ENTR|nr:hypothetical protein BA171_07365 [Candidatus Hamiltonella defensa (Bemisia tabaci)]